MALILIAIMVSILASCGNDKEIHSTENLTQETPIGKGKTTINPLSFKEEHFQNFDKPLIWPKDPWQIGLTKNEVMELEKFIGPNRKEIFALGQEYFKRYTYFKLHDQLYNLPRSVLFTPDYRVIVLIGEKGGVKLIGKALDPFHNYKEMKIKVAYDPSFGISLAKKMAFSNLEAEIYDRLKVLKLPGVVYTHTVYAKKNMPDKKIIFMKQYDRDMTHLLKNFRSTLTPKVKIKLILDLLQGLYGLHNNITCTYHPGGLGLDKQFKFYHSDLKPDNIFCSNDEKQRFKCNIGDFDLSSMPESIVGTPGYYPPQVLSPFANITPNIMMENGQRHDVWTMGVIAAMILADPGAKIFFGNSLPSFNFIQIKLLFGKYKQQPITASEHQIHAEIDAKVGPMTMEKYRWKYDQVKDVIKQMLHRDFRDRITSKEAYLRLKKIYDSVAEE